MTRDLKRLRVDMRVLVFGKTGQVATELQRQFNVVALGRQVMDFRRPERFEAVLDQHHADVFINVAAYTDVDGAEDNEELATKINGVAPTILAEISVKRNIPFLHVSTDYVFDGGGNSPWSPSDQPAPLNAYGRSKLEGEIGIAQVGGLFAILRTSWIFSSIGRNFVKTMLQLNAARDEVKIVSDQVGGPVAASDVAGALLKMARVLNEERGQSGIYHFSGSPDVSWADFARNIVLIAGGNLKVLDIPSSEFPTRAKRPCNSRMDCSKLQQIFDIERPDWQESLKAVVSDLKEQIHV